jgi:hypothetical protein
MQEAWKHLCGFEGLSEAGSSGRIRWLHLGGSGKILKTFNYRMHCIQADFSDPHRGKAHVLSIGSSSPSSSGIDEYGPTSTIAMASGRIITARISSTVLAPKIFAMRTLCADHTGSTGFAQARPVMFARCAKVLM